jgi:hypothetical protein
MPRSASKSSSSHDGVAISDHLDVSSHQKTPVVMFYLQDKPVHHSGSTRRAADGRAAAPMIFDNQGRDQRR